MEAYDLSQYYFMSCHRAHEVIDELYELIHDEDGNPKIKSEDVIGILHEARKVLAEELDMIKSSCIEYNEE